MDLQITLIGVFKRGLYTGLVTHLKPCLHCQFCMANQIVKKNYCVAIS